MGICRAELVNLHLHDLDIERETLFVARLQDRAVAQAEEIVHVRLAENLVRFSGRFSS